VADAVARGYLSGSRHTSRLPYLQRRQQGPFVSHRERLNEQLLAFAGVTSPAPA
jgi:hypothetical protein